MLSKLITKNIWDSHGWYSDILGEIVMGHTNVSMRITILQDSLSEHLESLVYESAFITRDFIVISVA